MLISFNSESKNKYNSFNKGNSFKFETSIKEKIVFKILLLQLHSYFSLGLYKPFPICFLMFIST